MWVCVCLASIFKSTKGIKLSLKRWKHPPDLRRKVHKLPPWVFFFSSFVCFFFFFIQEIEFSKEEVADPFNPRSSARLSQSTGGRRRLRQQRLPVSHLDLYTTSGAVPKDLGLQPPHKGLEAQWGSFVPDHEQVNSKISESILHSQSRPQVTGHLSAGDGSRPLFENAPWDVILAFTNHALDGNYLGCWCTVSFVVSGWQKKCIKVILNTVKQSRGKQELCLPSACNPLRSACNCRSIGRAGYD